MRSLASALVHKGVAIEKLISLSICLSAENYKLGVRWLYDRYGGKPSKTIYHLAANLKAIARHWLKTDEKTLELMARIVRQLAPPETGMSDKNRERLRPFQSEESLRKLVNLPQTIRRHIESAKSSHARRKGLSTAALAIEILLVAPLRMANLAALHLDHHFRKVGDRLYLVIPKDEVKNRKDLEYELPPETAEMIEWFKKNHRKANPGNRYLFAGEGMNHKSHTTMAVQIVGTVKAFMGLTVHPHLFRHIAATIYLKANPGNYEPVRLVLGHSRLDITTAAYAAQEETNARAHFATTVLSLRRRPVVAEAKASRGTRSPERNLPVKANPAITRASMRATSPGRCPTPTPKKRTTT